MRAFAVALAGAVILAGCKNPPPEPPPPTRVVEDVSTKQVFARCLVPLAPRASADVPSPVLDARCPREPAPARRYTKREMTVGTEKLTVELALSEAEREQGLMYRRALSENEGMLFDLEVEERHAFWMHDTCIPLDIGFLAADGTLVGVAENAPPLNDAPREVRCPSRYVLEVPAGWFRRHGVLPGTRIPVTP